jgi:hypothetical protein
MEHAGASGGSLTVVDPAIPVTPPQNEVETCHARAPIRVYLDERVIAPVRAT